MATWINFKELRSKVRIADVLASYNVQLKVKGDRASGFCPLPGHNGNKRSPSFSVHMGKGIFQCFSCGGKGNVIDLVVLLEGLDPANSGDVRKAALILNDRFGHLPDNHAPANAKPERDTTKPKPVAAKPPEASEPQQPPAATRVIVNAPLDFALKGLDCSHPYLSSRGLNPGTVGCFGLGYCARGMMAGRIAIPLHDPAAKLIGYAGRIVDDSKIDQDNPKYRFPSTRTRDGVDYEFKKSLFLYHGCFLPQLVSDLLVVEGFASTWWLWQAGYPHTVALMGASCSPEQANLIVQKVAADGRVWVFSDGDDAGERMASSVFLQVAPYRAVRLAKLEAGKQPTDCTPDELATFFGPPQVGKGASDE